MRNCEGSEWRDGYLDTSFTKQQPKLVFDASRQPGELHCIFEGDQRNMQQLAGSRKGTEQLGVANADGSYARRPTQPLPIFTFWDTIGEDV